MPGGGIDYSKWDKMDYGASSDEEEGSSAELSAGGEEEPAGAGRPRVTRLDGPSRVTRDADGMITIDSTQSQTSSTASPGSRPTNIVTGATVSKSAETSSQKQAPQPELIKSSQTHLNKRLTKNGGQFTDEATQSQIFWSQDRQEVTVYIEFDPCQIKSKDIRVVASGMVPYGERNAAVGGGGETHGKLKVMVKVDGGNTAMTLLEGELPHRIHLAEDEEEVEWEILSEDDRKFVVVPLRKAAPMAGVVIWWDCILQHCPKIDLSSIEGRSKEISGSSGAGMESAWEEAHRLFKEKVKMGALHKQHEIDIAED